MKLDEIHKSFINGQRKQAVEQMDDYGMYDFFEDYSELLERLYTKDSAKKEYLKDAASSYFRINER